MAVRGVPLVKAAPGFGVREIRMYSPIQGFGQLTNSLYAASASAERVIEVLDQRPAVTDPAHPRPLPRASGSIRFHRVGFAYPAASRPALRDIDFEVEPGEKLAVVGASGAGKSTLMRLLLRSYDPDRGAVTLDGIDLTQIALADLYGNIAAVLQETLVFDGSIADNIRWGRPDARDDQLVAAAEAAGAHQFITELPDGYHTRVGQRGRMLSGGQRQRLAIARAMIRDAPILLLDEPTTGLDAESSRRVLAPLRRLMADRTTIIISHNLLTVTDADRILFLDDGRIAGAGTHTELLAAVPAYARLYRLHRFSSDDIDPTTDVAHIEFEPAPGIASVPSFRVPRRGCLAVLGDPVSARAAMAPLLGYGDPAEGTVRLNGTNLRCYSPQRLRASVAVLRLGELASTPRVAGLPDVVVLDEPTAGLDARARNDLLGALAAVAVEHTTLLITQDPVVAALADHIVRPVPLPGVLSRL